MGLIYQMGVVKLARDGSVQHDISSVCTNNLTTDNQIKCDTIDLGKFKVCFKPNESFRTKSKL
jgi:hypothetical protein